MGSSDQADEVKYFNPKLIGKGLKEVSQEMIKTEGKNLSSRWFHSESENDFFMWKDEKGNLIKQQMSFHGLIVEWNIVDGLKTGYEFSDHSLEGNLNKHDSSVTYRFDEEVDLYSVQQALQVLEHIEGISEKDLMDLKDNYIHGPNIDTMHPEEFVRKYGSDPSESHLRPAKDALESLCEALAKALKWLSK